MTIKGGIYQMRFVRRILASLYPYQVYTEGWVWRRFATLAPKVLQLLLAPHLPLF